MELIILSGSRSENSTEFWRRWWLFSESGEKRQAGPSTPIRAGTRGGHTTAGTERAALWVLKFVLRFRSMPAPKAEEADFQLELSDEMLNETLDRTCQPQTSLLTCKQKGCPRLVR